MPSSGDLNSEVIDAYDFDVQPGKRPTAASLATCTYSVEVKTDQEDHTDKAYIEMFVPFIFRDFAGIYSNLLTQQHRT
jgi:hypothetical protein